MNRLTNYFKALQLSKQWLRSGRSACYGQDKDLEKAIIHAINGIEEMFTAMNNLASIAFDKKPRRRRP